MHSKIFQITQKRVEKDCYLNEDTLMQGAGSFFDYCGEIDEEERQLHIENLVNGVLPKGCLSLCPKIPYDTWGVQMNGNKTLPKQFA